jgi:hypothetical protein
VHDLYCHCDRNWEGWAAPAAQAGAAQLGASVNSSCWYIVFVKGVSPQIANPQSREFLGSFCKSQTRKFPWYPSSQIANPQICKEKSCVSDPDPHWFVSDIFEK